MEVEKIMAEMRSMIVKPMVEPLDLSDDFDQPFSPLDPLVIDEQSPNKSTSFEEEPYSPINPLVIDERSPINNVAKGFQPLKENITPVAASATKESVMLEGQVTADKQTPMYTFNKTAAPNMEEPEEILSHSASTTNEKEKSVLSFSEEENTTPSFREFAMNIQSSSTSSPRKNNQAEVEDLITNLESIQVPDEESSPEQVPENMDELIDKLIVKQENENNDENEIKQSKPKRGRPKKIFKKPHPYASKNSTLAAKGSCTDSTTKSCPSSDSFKGTSVTNTPVVSDRRVSLESVEEITAAMMSPVSFHSEDSGFDSGGTSPAVEDTTNKSPSPLDKLQGMLLLQSENAYNRKEFIKKSKREEPIVIDDEEESSELVEIPMPQNVNSGNEISNESKREEIIVIDDDDEAVNDAPHSQHVIPSMEPTVSKPKTISIRLEGSNSEIHEQAPQQSPTIFPNCSTSGQQGVCFSSTGNAGNDGSRDLKRTIERLKAIPYQTRINFLKKRLAYMPPDKRNCIMQKIKSKPGLYELVTGMSQPEQPIYQHQAVNNQMEYSQLYQQQRQYSVPQPGAQQQHQYGKPQPGAQQQHQYGKPQPGAQQQHQYGKPQPGAQQQHQYGKPQPGAQYSEPQPGAQQQHQYGKPQPGAQQQHQYSKPQPGAQQQHQYGKPQPGAQRQHQYGEPQPGAQRQHQYGEPQPGAQRQHQYGEPQPGAQRQHQYGEPQPGAQRQHQYGEPQPGAQRQHQYGEPQPGAQRQHQYGEPQPGAQRQHQYGEPQPGAQQQHQYGKPQPGAQQQHQYGERQPGAQQQHQYGEPQPGAWAWYQGYVDPSRACYQYEYNLNTPQPCPPAQYYPVTEGILMDLASVQPYNMNYYGGQPPGDGIG